MTRAARRKPVAPEPGSADVSPETIKKRARTTRKRAAPKPEASAEVAAEPLGVTKPAEPKPRKPPVARRAAIKAAEAITTKEPAAPRKSRSRKAVAAAPPKTVVAPARAAREPSHDEIALRAYEIWERRGRTTGHADDDWFLAELELRTEL